MYVSGRHDEETPCWKPLRRCFINGIAHSGVHLSRKYSYIARIRVCVGGHHASFFEVDTKRVMNWLIEWADKHHPLSARRYIGR